MEISWSLGAMVIGTGRRIQYVFSSESVGDQSVVVHVRSPRYAIVRADTVVVSAVSPPDLWLIVEADMRQEGAIAGMWVSGSFNGYRPSDTSMQDYDGDGIWTSIISVSRESAHYFRFVRSVDPLVEETVPASCQGPGAQYRRVELFDRDVRYRSVYGGCPEG